MPLALIVVIALHVLSAVFWAGSTFTLARTAGSQADRLFLPQMGAASVAVISGGALWRFLHEGSFGLSEEILATGAVCALVAAAIQGVLIGPVRHKVSGAILAEMGPIVHRIATAHRIAAGLLVITIICMAVARYV